MPNRVRKVRNLMLFTLFILVILSIVLFFGLCYQEVRIWVYPQPYPVEPQTAPFKEVSFQTEDGLTIYGWYVPSESGKVVLGLHGLGANRDQFRVHADYLMEAGYGILSIDFRNSGNSEGDVTSMGVYEIQDARAAYQFLREQDEVQQIVLMGHSMGAGIASHLMQEVDADGLIMDATFADFSSIVRAGVIARGFPATPITEVLMTMAGVLSRADWYSLRPIDWLASLDDPILLLHGTDDLTIPIDNAYRLVEANPQIKLVVFEGGAHSNLYELDPDLYRDEVLHYLDSILN